MVNIDGTSFGSITIDGRRYLYDVWVFADGSIKQRDRNHEFTREELELLIEERPKLIVIGTGQSGCVRIDEAAAKEAKERGVEIVSDITPSAIKRYNEAIKSKRRVIGAFHVTC